MKALISALVAGLAVYGGLSLVEIAYHRLVHNRSRTYWWGVWVFAILAAIYTYLNSIGRL